MTTQSLLSGKAAVVTWRGARAGRGRSPCACCGPGPSSMRSMCCRPTTRCGTRCAREARGRRASADTRGGRGQRSRLADAGRADRARGAPLYGLVNNAGVTLRKTVTETSHAEWRRLLDINLDGPFLAIHVLAGDAGRRVHRQYLVHRRPDRLFQRGLHGQQMGLRGLTRAAALELADGAYA